jgi:hypothetical protein
MSTCQTGSFDASSMPRSDTRGASTVKTTLPAASFTTAPTGGTLNTTIFVQSVGYPTVSTLIAGTFLPGTAGAAEPPVPLSPSTTVLVAVVCGAEQAERITMASAAPGECVRTWVSTRSMLRIARPGVLTEFVEEMAAFSPRW